MSTLLLLLLLLPPVQTGNATVADAQRLVDAGKFDAAKSMLEQVIARDGTDAGAHMLLGKILSGHFEKFDDAEEQMEKAVELADGNAEFHFQLGVLYGGQAQRASVFSKLSYAGKIKSQFQRAVDLAPDHVRYRMALISYYLQAPGIAGGSVAKAREHAGELLARDPFEGHMALAGIADYEKDPGATEREYLAAISANAAAWRPHHRLGYLYLKLNRVDDAIAQFTQYVRKAPGDPNSHDSLADALSAKGDRDAALASYRNALKVNPRFPSSLYGAGRCCDEQGKKDEAAEYYRRFLETNPKGDDAGRAKERLRVLHGDE
jgi:tetratricopeptide (TPR) repeat protein